MNEKDSILFTLYTKLGFHKQFYLKDRYFINPRFSYSGSGGETLRGAPCLPIEIFIKSLSYNDINGHKEEFFNSSLKFLYRNVDFLKKEKKINDEYELSFELYKMGVGRYHFGKGALEAFLSNIYILEPLMDPEIKKIKYNLKGKYLHDLIAYLYVHYSHDLIYFPFQGNRSLDLESLEKAEKLNNKQKPYKRTNDITKIFLLITKEKLLLFNKKKIEILMKILRKFLILGDIIK